MKRRLILWGINLAFLGFTCCGSCITAFAAPSAQGPDVPRNVELVNAAWEAFGAQDYERAISASDRCIGRFKDQADAQQETLQRAQAPMPPTGRVTEKQKSAIFQQGLLNDVATCFWVKARSAQLLKRFDLAKEAFQTAAKYTYARTWDTHGWFWSPAEDAADRLIDLK
jgi:hypothetical protein